MTTSELIRAEEIVAGWLDGEDGPAGPVFTREYSEADIVMTDPGQSGRCGTVCTGSHGYDCC